MPPNNTIMMDGAEKSSGQFNPVGFFNVRLNLGTRASSILAIIKDVAGARSGLDHAICGSAVEHSHPHHHSGCSGAVSSSKCCVVNSTIC